MIKREINDQINSCFLYITTPILGTIYMWNTGLSFLLIAQLLILV